MSGQPDLDRRASRRRFLIGAAGVAGAAGAAGAAMADDAGSSDHGAGDHGANHRGRRRGEMRGACLPFHGVHQQGIATPAQPHTYFAAFDVTAESRQDLADLMRSWTAAAALLTRGEPLGEAGADPGAPPADTGEALDLPPSRLTLTFGLGPSLFARDGVDRFGLAARRPEAFVDLPRFVGDQLIPERTGGDLCVQACADDPQAAFRAVRQLGRVAGDKARIRWVQAGFVSGARDGASPRNLMGFKDGSMNPDVNDAAVMDRHVWVGEEGGAWMRGGTYMVARPTRIALEHWDRMKLAFQEQTVGRRKLTGAPLGARHERDPLPLDAVDADGNPVIAENAHVRLAAPETNDGAQILRRSYSYDNGVSFVAERWPPWRQGLELDVGLLFICHQRDPRAGFIKIFERMSRFDMMNQFVTPIAGGLFACPGGVAPGRYLAEDLFERA
jgi:deferrochelatase/peroxidase EfeB